MTDMDKMMIEKATDAVWKCGVAMLTRSDAEKCARAAIRAYNPNERLREALEAAFHEALRRYPAAHNALVFMWAASGAAGREPTEEQLKWARSKIAALSPLPQGDG